MPTLSIRSGPSAGTEFQFSKDLVIGRGAAADYSIDDPAISRRHASLTLHHGRCVIADLRSGNGTRVNGERIREPRELRDGDEFQLGDVVFVFHSGAEQKPSMTTSSVMLKDSVQAILHSMAAGTLSLPNPTAGGEAKALVTMTRRMQVIYDVAEAIGEILDEDALLSLIMSRLFKVFPQAARGFIMTYDSSTGALETRVATTRDGQAAEIAVSRTLVNDVIENRRGILSADAMQDDRFTGKETIQQLEIRSVIVAPLIAHGEVFGVIHIDGVDTSRPFNKDDMELLIGIGSQAGMALSNARLHRRLVAQELLEQDLALAKRIQARFLPKSAPRVDGYEFEGSYLSAMEVGGDYYDFFSLPRGAVGVALGDVSGKGVSAALYMAKLSSEVRFHSAASDEPAEIMARVNQAMTAELEEGMFVTMIFLALNTATGEVKAVNAGHLTPLLRRASGEVVSIELPRSVPLGVMEQSRFQSARFNLQRGDTVVLYTDGVSEATSPDMELFGEGRLVASIQNSDGTPAGVSQSVLHSVRQFLDSAPQNDDITLLCFGQGMISGTRTFVRRD
jgi:sigma-B regulation protein RsbU (phosphoserine phosphatase)